VMEKKAKPKSWADCKFGDIAQIRSGYAFKSSTFKKQKADNSDVPLIKQSQLKGTHVDLTDAVFLPSKFMNEHKNYIIRKGDVLIGMSGSIGRVCLYDKEFPALQNQRTGKIESFSPDKIDARFFGIYLSSVERTLVEYSKGMGVQNISAKDIEGLPFALPPINEQKRIVNKIEELFSELDKGIEILKIAHAQLKLYRQSVLKSAFEGNLTKDWREENKDKLEPADELLKRIKQEREAHYQQQLENWNSAVKTWEQNGKEGKKPAKPRNFLVPDGISIDVLKILPQLPENWEWCKVGHLFNVYVGSTPSRKKQSFWHGSIPWISSGEVAFCKVNDTEEKITQEGYESASTQIHPIGTVMLAMIGEGKTRGQAAILNIEAAHNQNTAAIRVSETECSTLLFYYYLLYQYELTRRLGSGNNQKALNKDRVSNMTLPLMSLPEQIQIALEIENQLSVIESIEQTIETELKKSEVLRQSILKKAFSGQLARQDPSDEPASALLERIKAEKEKVTKTKKKKRKAA
jgi:type I restriction enzyme, S subunit